MRLPRHQIPVLVSAVAPLLSLHGELTPQRPSPPRQISAPCTNTHSMCSPHDTAPLPHGSPDPTSSEPYETLPRKYHPRNPLFN
ncbi:hypothetical protein L484_020907 [Morus notabilis]|uniref:Secreted protein n=1 Tax=Morus notabilis TaxID=981085 RepID=W9QP03_9ROSA|nr:hypothetical protein L484_020907 [Morus notabilis]